MIDPTNMVRWVKAYQPSGFEFLGAASDGEVFIQNSSPAYVNSPEAPEAEGDFIRAFKATFPEAKVLTFVVRPSLRQAEEMLQQLNQYLEGREGPRPKKNLLNIGEF